MKVWKIAIVITLVLGLILVNNVKAIGDYLAVLVARRITKLQKVRVEL